MQKGIMVAPIKGKNTNSDRNGGGRSQHLGQELRGKAAVAETDNKRGLKQLAMKKGRTEGQIAESESTVERIEAVKGSKVNNGAGAPGTSKGRQHRRESMENGRRSGGHIVTTGQGNRDRNNLAGSGQEYAWDPFASGHFKYWG